MADLGLLQAWGMWFDNIQVNQYTLYGVSVLALGRIGKVVSFFAGMTVILDIIGPDRIRQFAGTFKRFDPVRSLTLRKVGLLLSALGLLVAIVSLVSTMFRFGPAVDGIVAVLGYVVAVLTLMATPRIARGLARVLASGLESRSWERVIRWSAVMLLVLGFHFDLLAS
ncbi:hypothetical protein ACFFV7_38900 [Nonomuraea spiralis]|uniref:Uncharacterized protein n=1 Tax=Nonomuraea spiralis TaxID=46182 RepID=A0ABV5IRM7_9ACTN|nr:hypothetical protein [Nonomuraea spiralis]GGT45943.1 hypothetical protein GCM10010176_106370 [Nonomuraea spiralis]